MQHSIPTRGRLLPRWGASTLLVFLVAFSAAVRAEDEAVCKGAIGKVVASRIQARYEGIRDLRGAFTQTNESATLGGAPLMSPEPKTGKVVFSKPGKMHWSYETPEKSVVVSNGEWLWIHDVEAGSVTRLAVTAGFLSGAALQFLLGDGQILEAFEVEAVECGPTQVRLDLVPKADATYERLGLLATRETGDIVETSVLDLFGNLTRIAFRDVETNLAPTASTFEFEVPEGVELIEYEGLRDPEIARPLAEFFCVAPDPDSDPICVSTRGTPHVIAWQRERNCVAMQSRRSRSDLASHSAARGSGAT